MWTDERILRVAAAIDIKKPEYDPHEADIVTAARAGERHERRPRDFHRGQARSPSVKVQRAFTAFGGAGPFAASRRSRSGRITFP